MTPLVGMLMLITVGLAAWAAYALRGQRDYGLALVLVGTLAAADVLGVFLVFSQ